MRTIFHIDMDAFFAAIEVAQNPSLRGKPVVIGGPSDKRGVVSTCSYEARSYGVRSAMSTAEARKRCPHAIFIAGNHQLYRSYSAAIMEIFHSCTPYVETVSIDEAYLDVSRVMRQYGGPEALGQLLKEIIWRQMALTCSVGIASNKLVAKVASSTYKPNGLLHVKAGEESQFLAPLPLEILPGIGKKTLPQMHKEGWLTIGDIQQAGCEVLMERFGGWGYQLYNSSMGHDNRPVQWEERPPKSLGAEETFESDIGDLETLQAALKRLCDKVWSRLQAHKMRARSLQIKLRYASFRTVTRSHTFDRHINDWEEISTAAKRLLSLHRDPSEPLRLVGIALDKLTSGYWQPLLWE